MSNIEITCEMNIDDKKTIEHSGLALLETIASERDKTNHKFFIISAAYDKIFKKYNWISLTILILSTLVTLIEAIRLTISDFVNNKNYDIDIILINFGINIITLTIGTIITILSSIVRFKNYREILEKLKDNERILITYKDKYNRKYEKLLNMIIVGNLTEQDIKDMNDKISDYSNQIESINLLEYLRLTDLLKFNKYKAQFDVEMKKIEIEKLLALQKQEKETENNLGQRDIKKNIQIEKIKKQLFDKSNNFM